MTTEPAPTPPTEEPRDIEDAYNRLRHSHRHIAEKNLRLLAEVARLRSDLNQATAVVEAACAYVDHYPELIAVLRSLSDEDRRAGDGNEARIALADAVDAFRAAPTGGVEG